MNAAGDPPYILHICLPEDWQAAIVEGQYQPNSLNDVGFIHCSTPAQILHVANTFYHTDHELLLLWIKTSKLNTPLKWEVAEGEVFPHIYGGLNLEAVVDVYDFVADGDQYFRVIPGLAEHG